MATLKTDERLTLIESRLSRIEASLKLTPAQVIPKPDPSAKVYKPAPVTPAARLAMAEEASAQARTGNWLGIIAVICFIIAAGFIVKLSIESGWLTPERQVGLAALLGLALMGAGFALLESDRTYASFLPGAGIVVLYLTAFAAHRYYSLITFEAAIALTFVVACLSICCYRLIRHDTYALIAAAGAYVAPIALGLRAYAEFSLYYFLLCSVAFAIISVWVKSRALTLVSSYLAILASGFIGLDLRQDQLVAGLLAIHFLVFAVGTYLYSIQHKQALTENEAWSFLPVLLLFYAIEYTLLERINADLAPFISLGFAGVLVGLYHLAKDHFPEGLGSQTVVIAFATVVCFHSIYLELMPGDMRRWLFVLILLAFALLPVNLSVQKKGNIFRFPALAVLIILVIEYIAIFARLLFDQDQSLLVFFPALGSMWLVLLVAQHKFAEKPNYGYTLLGAAHLLAVMGLYRLTTDTGSLAISASWLFYAVVVMVFAFARKDEVMAKSALAVLAFAAGKALLYDAASAPTVVRIFCLLLTGAVLYGCGLFLRKLGNWESWRK